MENSLKFYDIYSFPGNTWTTLLCTCTCTLRLARENCFLFPLLFILHFLFLKKLFNSTTPHTAPCRPRAHSYCKHPRGIAKVHFHLNPSTCAQLTGRAVRTGPSLLSATQHPPSQSAPASSQLALFFFSVAAPALIALPALCPELHVHVYH